MDRAQEPHVDRWSTSEMPQRERLSQWAAALKSALLPLTIRRADAKSFESDMVRASLGPVAVVHQNGSPHACQRTRSELALTTEHTFNLIMSLDRPWSMAHCGDMRVSPRAIVLHDSDYPVALSIPDRYRFINVQLSEAWVKKWLPDPARLLGRCIPGDAGWGGVLSNYLTQLTPDLLARAPLPYSVLVDQIGVLLALISAETSSGLPAPAPAPRSLGERIRDVIRQRCQETALSAADVAGSLDVSVRTVHRALAACRETFGAALIEARVEVALRMLRSPAFARLTVSEIGRRAGFSDPSHFARVLHRRTGLSPRQHRGSRPTPEAEAGLRPAAGEFSGSPSELEARGD